ncbi:hypothetical protein SARC_17621, partial [Sphaeroforma arctica JP610]
TTTDTTVHVPALLDGEPHREIATILEGPSNDILDMSKFTESKTKTLTQSAVLDAAPVVSPVKETAAVCIGGCVYIGECMLMCVCIYSY